MNCAVDGCVKDVVCKEMCWAHYLRNRKYGSPTFRPVRSDRGKSKTDPLSPTRTSSGAHARIYREWGAASNFGCIKCPAPAKDWAYDGTDPSELMELTGRRAGLRYSIFPEFYMPLCRKCHNARDKALAAKELRHYRIANHG